MVITDKKAEKLKQTEPPGSAVKEQKGTTHTDLNWIKILKISKKQGKKRNVIVFITIISLLSNMNTLI